MEGGPHQGHCNIFVILKTVLLPSPQLFVILADLDYSRDLAAGGSGDRSSWSCCNDKLNHGEDAEFSGYP